MKPVLPCVLALCASLYAVGGAQTASPLYKDPGAPVADRVRDLLKVMTVEEKVAQLQSNWVLPSFSGARSPSVFLPDGVSDEQVRKIAGSGLGTFVFLDEFLAAGDALDARIRTARRNQLQQWVVKNTRLGIPVLFHGEALHGLVAPGATSFPVPVGLGSTWDPAFVEQVFSTVAREARAAGNVLVLAPVLDVIRDPRFGRVEEMYSEDPYLVGQMAVAAVRGLQGHNPGGRLDEQHVYATAKHFVHGQPENGTNVGPNDVSERTLRSVFLPPFEQVIKRAGIEAVMPSYNENNGGIPSHANPWLLRDVLRKEFGFTGLAVSDYMGIEQLATLQHVAEDRDAAAVLALESGVDMELPTASAYPSLVNAVRSGKVSGGLLDEAVGRVLSAKFRAGLFEHPFIDEKRTQAVVGSKEHVALAREAANRSIVLLKNAGNLLPLNPAALQTIAVIGPNGQKMRLGTYSGLPPYYVSVVDGIRARVGNGTKVVFAEGCRISEPDAGPHQNGMAPYEPPARETDQRLMNEAIAAGKTADLVVLALGSNEAVSREAPGNIGQRKPVLGDTDTLDLPGRQNELARAIVALGKPTVAVLLNGRPYAIEQLAADVPAILEGWYLGQETGHAIAGVLFGDVNPSGHLTVSVARNVGQLPVYYYKTPAARRGYVFRENRPLFPFGHGLSYTTFTMGAPVLDRDTIAPSESAKVTVRVTNTGSRRGATVVQMYVRHPTSSVVQPVMALRAFERVEIAAGASATVTFDVGPEQLSILNSRMLRAVEPGPVDLLIGMSSAETSSVRLKVTR